MRPRTAKRENVDGQYLITLRVKYEPDATDLQRSLGWVTPELVDADLTVTDGENVREWSGVVDNATYARLDDAWGLDGQLGSRMFDGLEWESEGSSPIIWVRLRSVSVNGSSPRHA